MFFRNRNLYRHTGFLGDPILKEMAKIQKNDTSLNKFRIQKVEEKPVFRGVADNELILGCTDRDMDTLVTYPYNGLSFGMAVLGQRGDGKTQLVKSLVLPQFHDKWGQFIVFFDPKNDYSNLAQKQSEPQFVEILNRFNIKPRAYNATYWKHVFFQLDSRPGIEYIITPDCLNQLEWTKRREAAKELFSNRGDLHEKVEETLNYIIGKHVPKSIKLWEEKNEEFKRLTLERRADNKIYSKAISGKFEQRLEEMINSGLFGDENQKIIMEVDENDKPLPGKTKKVGRLRLPESLAATQVNGRQGDGIAVVEMDLEGGRDYISSIIGKLAIASLWSDKKMYVEGHGQAGGVLYRPVTVVIDEGDILLPRAANAKSPSRDQALQLLTRGRQLGFSEIVISQQPEQLSKVLLNNVDYVLTTRLKSAEIIDYLRKKFPLEDGHIEELRKLEYNPQKKPVQWALITPDPENPYVPFYPLPPSTQIKRE